MVIPLSELCRPGKSQAVVESRRTPYAAEKYHAGSISESSTDIFAGVRSPVAKTRHYVLRCSVFASLNLKSFAPSTKLRVWFIQLSSCFYPIDARIASLSLSPPHSRSARRAAPIDPD
jgi:hypothetical protein